MISHFFFADYLKRSIQKSLDASGYSYVTVKSAHLSFDALIREESEGYLRAKMDNREIIIKIHVIGNPIWSQKLSVNVATPMARLSFMIW
jgi:hypothetical protein